MEKINIDSLISESRNIPDMNVWLEKVATLLNKSVDELKQQGRTSVLNELKSVAGDEVNPGSGTDASMAKGYLGWYDGKKNARETTKQAFNDEGESIPAAKTVSITIGTPSSNTPVSSDEDVATSESPNKVMTYDQRKKAETAKLVAEKERKAREKVSGKSEDIKTWRQNGK